MGKCQISQSWCGLGLKILVRPCSQAHAPKTSYDKKSEEDNKNIFTNKHAMIFDNNIQLFLF